MHTLALLLVVSLGQADATQPWHSPETAFQVAAADAQSIGPDAIFYRYIHLPAADEQTLRWHVYTVNECVSELQNPNIVLPDLIGDGHVARWDLRLLAPRIRSDGTPDVFRLMDVWDRIFDESLYVKLIEPIKAKVAVAPYKASDGKTYNFKLLQRSHVPDALFEPHGSALTAATLCGTPLVSLHEFQRMALTTLDGGLYYEFLGLPSTVDDLLALFGADRAKIERLRSDQRAVTLISGVTNAPRRVIVMPGIQSRPSENQGLIWITEDFIGAEITPETDPARNLHGNKHDASELIIDRPNGGHVYYLADGNGNRQDAAPDNVATDTTIEVHGDRRLQPARSCIVCHAMNQARGLRDFGKDVQKLLSGRLDYAADRTTLSGDELDNLQRTIGRYQWNPDKLISRSRDDYSDFIVRATATMQPEDIGEMTRRFFHDYWESPVTPLQACIELGLTVPEGANPVDVLARSLPPRNAEITPGLLAEDVYIAALMQGQSIRRPNFLHIVLEMRRRLQPVE